MKTTSVLGNLGWPFDQVKTEGTLSLRWEGEDGMARSATVVHQGGEIKALSHRVDPEMGRVEVAELRWRVVGGAAEGALFKVAGKPSDEGAALEAFQAFASECDLDPVFRPAAAGAVPAKLAL